MSLCIGNFYSGEIRRTYGNYAAKALHSIDVYKRQVLRLQRTQPKDRRVYTALTGILAVPQAIPEEAEAGQGRQLRKAADTGSS